MAIGKLNKKNQSLKATTVDSFLSKAEDNKPTSFLMDLSTLSLQELVNQYIEVDRQSHILKGQILLEARKRFPSNQEFGIWRSLNFSGRLPQQTANNLMNLAKFFNESSRPLGNIPVSAGYLIAAPINQDIADIVYEKALKSENPTLQDIRDTISELKPKVKDIREPSDLDLVLSMIDKLNDVDHKALINILVSKLSNDERKLLVDRLSMDLD